MDWLRRQGGQFPWVTQRCFCAFILGSLCLPAPQQAAMVLRVSAPACLTQDVCPLPPPLSSAPEPRHSLQEPPSHTAGPGALHLSGGRGVHTPRLGVASGRPCPWALMLRDKGTGKRKLLSRNQSKRGAVLPGEGSDWERQAPGNPDWGQ